MYYVVLTKESTGGLPTVISRNSAYFADYIQSGYEIVFEGYKKDCQDVADEMLTAFCD